MNGKKALAAALFLSAFQCLPSHAVDFVEQKDFQERFVRAISIANEFLEVSDSPRFRLVSAEVELSLVKEKGINSGLKIPILPVEGNVDILGMESSKEKFTYLPRSQVQIGGDDDFGLIAFVKSIQQKLHDESSTVVMTRAEREQVFIIKYTADGKVSFFNMVSLGGSGSSEHTHKAKFTFCLEDQAGDCVDP